MGAYMLCSISVQYAIYSIFVTIADKKCACAAEILTSHSANDAVNK